MSVERGEETLGGVGVLDFHGLSLTTGPCSLDLLAPLVADRACGGLLASWRGLLVLSKGLFYLFHHLILLQQNAVDPLLQTGYLLLVTHDLAHLAWHTLSPAQVAEQVVAVLVLEQQGHTDLFSHFVVSEPCEVGPGLSTVAYWGTEKVGQG